MAPQRDNRFKVSALLHAGHKVSEVANLVGVSRITVYAIKKCMNYGKSVNRRTSSGRKTVVDYNRASGGLNKNRIITAKPHEL